MCRSWPARIAMTAVFFGNGVAFGALAGNIVRLQKLGGLTPSALGLALLAISSGAVLTMPATAVLAPRVGSARIALVAALSLGLSLSGPALVLGHLHGNTAWLALLAAMLPIGMAVGAMDVSMNARGSDLERDWGAPIMSSFHGGWSVGALTGSAVAAAFAGVGFSAASALAAGGLLAAALGLGALRLRRGEVRRPPEKLRLRLPSAAMAGLCAITCLCFSMEGAMADWLGVYLGRVLRATDALASGAYSGFALAMTVGRLTGDAVVRRWGAVRAMLGGALLAGVGAAAGLAMGAPLPAAAAFALVGFGLANVVPVAFSASGRRGGPVGVGMVASAGYLGLMAGPPLLGFSAQATSLAAPMVYVLLGAGAIAWLARSVRGP